MVAALIWSALVLLGVGLAFADDWAKKRRRGLACSRCACLIPHDMRFCFGCGTEGIPVQFRCGPCGMRLRAEANYCSRCGASSAWSPNHTAGRFSPPFTAA